MTAPAEQLADRLHDSLTNKSGKEREDDVVNIIKTNDLITRCHAAQYYEAKYNSELREDLKKKLGGDFRNLAGLCFLNPIELDVKLLQKAFKGTSNKEDTVIEILTSRSYDYLQVVQRIYQQKLGSELAKDVEKHFGGVIQKCLLYLLGTKRKENPNPDLNFCVEEAKKLVSCKDGEWTKNEALFKEIFVDRSPEELVAIGRSYLQLTGTHFLDALEKRMGGTDRKLIREIMFNNIIPHELFAEKLDNAIKGMGTNEEVVDRVLVTRSNIDMPEIKEMYQFKVKKSLEESLKDDTSGKYQELCLFLAQK